MTAGTTEADANGTRRAGTRRRSGRDSGASALLAANAARSADLADAFTDRLALNDARIRAMSERLLVLTQVPASGSCYDYCGRLLHALLAAVYRPIN